MFTSSVAATVGERRPLAAAKYLEVFKISVINQLAYIYDVFVGSFFMLVVMYVFVQLWRTTFAVTGQRTIDGFDLGQVLWYLVVTESMVSSVPRLTRKLDTEVKSGDVAYSLNKPYNYILFHYAGFLGEWTVKFGVNFLLGAAIVGSAVGPLPFLPLAWLGQVLAILGGITLFFLNMASLGLLAFWVEDASALYLIYERSLWILGGMLIPLDFFPPAWRAVAEWLPFNHILYGPARTLAHFQPARFWSLLWHQAAWIIFFTVLVSLLYRAGVRRLNVNGG